MVPGHLIIVLFFVNEIGLPLAEVQHITGKLDGPFCGKDILCENYNFAICFLKRKYKNCGGISDKNLLIDTGQCMTKLLPGEGKSTFDGETLLKNVSFDLFDKKISDVGKMMIFVSGIGNSEDFQTCETNRTQSNNTMTTVVESFRSGPRFRMTIQLVAVCKEDNCHAMCEECDPITTTPETTSVDQTSTITIENNPKMDNTENETTTGQYQTSDSSTEFINTKNNLFSVISTEENNSWSTNSQSKRSYSTTTVQPVSSSDYHSTPEKSVNHNVKNNRSSTFTLQSVSQITDLTPASTTTVTEDPTAYSHTSNSTKISTIDNMDNTGKINLEIYTTTEKGLTSDVWIEATTTGTIVSSNTPTEAISIVSTTSEGKISGSTRTLESEVTTEHNTIRQTGSSFTPTRRPNFSRPTTEEFTFSKTLRYNDKDILTTNIPGSAEIKNRTASSVNRVYNSTPKLPISSGVNTLTLPTTTPQTARSPINRTITTESNHIPSSTTPISTLATSKDIPLTRNLTRTNTTPSIRLESNPVRPSVVYTYKNTTNIYPLKPDVNPARHSDVIIIAGAAVGGIFLITLVLVFCNLWFKRKNRAKEEIYNTKFYHVY